MRTALLLALTCLITLPVLVPPIPKPEPPPSPPYDWTVEGYKMVGYQWVKQPDHCLKTTNLQQAIKYEAEYSCGSRNKSLSQARTSALCSEVSDLVSYSPAIGLPPQLERVGFTVWAFRLEGGKWVKDPTRCWTSRPATYTVHSCIGLRQEDQRRGGMRVRRPTPPSAPSYTVHNSVTPKGPQGIGSPYGRGSDGSQILFKGRHMTIESGGVPLSY